MGSIKDRNGLDLTEAEDIKKRWQEYTEELYKKEFHDPDNHDGVITHLEPDILEYTRVSPGGRGHWCLAQPSPAGHLHCLLLLTPHLSRPWALQKTRRQSKQNKETKRDHTGSEREAWRAAVHGVAESNMTEHTTGV